MNKTETFRLRWRGREFGPFVWLEISRLLDEHEIGLRHEIEVDGAWVTLETHLEQRRREQAARADTSQPQRIELPVSEPVATPVSSPSRQRARPAAAASATASPRRSWKLFVALGLVLGFLGAHNWYAGHRGTALIQLVLTALTWWLGLGLFLSWLWALIELLIIHTDGHGRRLV